MLLSEVIQPDLIKIGLEAHSKWEAIEELIDLLINAHELRMVDRAEVTEAVMNRERSLSTGLEHGLAVPHGAVSCVHDILVTMGTSQQGVPFESVDGQPARLVVLLVIPQGSFQRHVRTLATIARLASDRELRERVYNAEAPEEVMEAIAELESSSRG
jgi:mannitol/fructose-specific phosphotransferase system IIA component (Ntr-type)